MSIKIVGILNITPDSFYDGGRYLTNGQILDRLAEIAQEGADIFDIGGESSRPGAQTVSVQEEIDRVCPAIEIAKKNFNLPVSLDTYKSPVAAQGLKLGVDIINDISGLSDPEMCSLIAKFGKGVIIMHMKGKPENMQSNTEYEDILKDIYNFLKNRKDIALKSGIAEDKVIIDPGIGFGKSLNDNYHIIKNLGLFKGIESPILIGLSNKSLISNLYETSEERLPATIALNSIAAVNGAQYIRVHDVKEHYLALKAVSKLIEE